MMTKFVGVFRELASFNELLNTQVELILVERLHRNWLKVCNTSAPALAPEVKSMLLRKQVDIGDECVCRPSEDLLCISRHHCGQILVTMFASDIVCMSHTNE